MFPLKTLRKRFKRSQGGKKTKEETTAEERRQPKSGKQKVNEGTTQEHRADLGLTPGGTVTWAPTGVTRVVYARGRKTNPVFFTQQGRATKAPTN